MPTNSRWSREDFGGGVVRHAPNDTVEVVHHVTRHHRAEIEVWPPRAEVTFSDERSANPANTMIRFEATVLNACSTAVRWDVLGAAGGPGAGSIDSTGLYRAPRWASGLDGATDVVVATLVEDPLRTAYAWVTLAGEGPWPVPQPRLELLPKTAYLYYPSGYDNAYIDSSNTMQFFRAHLRHSPSQIVEWLVDGVVQAGQTEHVFLYTVSGGGAPKEVTVEARVPGEPTAVDSAKVMLTNYDWPGIP
jgi:hypothetical protein